MLTNEIMRLLGDGPIVNQDKNGTNVPKSERVCVVLLHCNVVIYICSKQSVSQSVSYFLLNQNY